MLNQWPDWIFFAWLADLTTAGMSQGGFSLNRKWDQVPGGRDDIGTVALMPVGLGYFSLALRT